MYEKKKNKMKIQSCIVKDKRNESAKQGALHAGRNYTKYVLDCQGKEVVLAIGEEDGQVFMDVKEGNTTTSLSGMRAIEYLLR